MNNRTTAHTVNRDSVDQVSLSSRKGSAYAAGEETEGRLLYGRITEPADVMADAEGITHWQKCYGDLWKVKVAFEKKYNR